MFWRQCQKNLANLYASASSDCLGPTKSKAAVKHEKKVWQTEKRRGAEEPDQGVCGMGRDGYERFGKTVL